jgi:hypothetical protein
MATQDNLDFEALAESMDLSVEQVSALFDRADAAWEKIKERTLDCDAYNGPLLDYDEAIARSEQTDMDRMYLKVGPFDVKLAKTDEGLVVDVYPWKEEGSDIVLASTYAFDSDAEAACEDDG